MRTINRMRKAMSLLGRIFKIKSNIAKANDVYISAPNRDSKIRVRNYFPNITDNIDILPIIIFVHGGGYVCGSIETHEELAKDLCSRTKAIIASVEYQLAPEHPFPAGLEDIYTVLKYYKSHANEMGGDSNMIAICGDSAGGNLATATCIMSRDRDGPKICAQLLFYPTLDAKTDTNSWNKLGKYIIPTKTMHSLVIKSYASGKDSNEPLISPLGAGLSNLPPCLIIVGSLDPLCSECESYAIQLKAAGNWAKTIVLQRTIHGFAQLPQSFLANPHREKAMSFAFSFLKHIFKMKNN